MYRLVRRERCNSEGDSQTHWRWHPSLLGQHDCDIRQLPLVSCHGGVPEGVPRTGLTPHECSLVTLNGYLRDTTSQWRNCMMATKLLRL